MSSRNTKKDPREVKKKNALNAEIKSFMAENKDDVSSVHGLGDTVSNNQPSEPASSRLSMFGNDFMTNRFMMDLPSSKLSWHMESPLGKSLTDWGDGTDFDVSWDVFIPKKLFYNYLG